MGVGGQGGRLLCSLFLLSLPSSPAPHSGSVCSVGSPEACQLQPFLSALAHVYPREAWAGRLAPPRSPFPGLGPLGPSIWTTRLLTFNAGPPPHPAPGHTPQATILHFHFTLFWGLPGLCDFGALSPLIIGDLHPEGSAHLCGLQCCVRATNQPGFRSGSWVAATASINLQRLGSSPKAPRDLCSAL